MILNETELNGILEKHAAFENANSEKITPYYLRVIKGNKAMSSLNSLRNNEGNEFFTDTDRKKLIRDHFVEIYKKDPNEPDDLTGCIENFIGDEIMQNPMYQIRRPYGLAFVIYFWWLGELLLLYI